MYTSITNTLSIIIAVTTIIPMDVTLILTVPETLNPKPYTLNPVMPEAPQPTELLTLENETYLLALEASVTPKFTIFLSSLAFLR